MHSHDVTVSRDIWHRYREVREIYEYGKKNWVSGGSIESARDRLLHIKFQ
jgi:hypothetical protein